jgi:uncharacterized protein YutE (UPF0331/DUF86 family)
LDHSYRRVERLPADLEAASPDELESVEAFTSRFARTVDLLVNKLLRCLDRVELLSPGTLLDTVNRAEQRGFVERAALLREMKDVRNIIARDYAGAQLAEVLRYCRDHKPVLDAICERVEAYARTLLVPRQ